MESQQLWKFDILKARQRTVRADGARNVRQGAMLANQGSALRPQGAMLAYRDNALAPRATPKFQANTGRTKVMGLKQYKPTSPGRRFQTVSDFSEITTSKPEKSLLAPLPKHAGRNNYGREPRVTRAVETSVAIVSSISSATRTAFLQKLPQSNTTPIAQLALLCFTMQTAKSYTFCIHVAYPLEIPSSQVQMQTSNPAMLYLWKTFQLVH